MSCIIEQSRCPFELNRIKRAPIQVDGCRVETVAAGFGEISSRNALRSFGFYRCSCFLLINDKTRLTLLAHIQPDLKDLHHATGDLMASRFDKYFKHMEEIGGRISLVPILFADYGQTKLILSAYKDKISEIKEPIKVEYPPISIPMTEIPQPWAVLYRPTSGMLFIQRQEHPRCFSMHLDDVSSKPEFLHGHPVSPDLGTAMIPRPPDNDTLLGKGVRGFMRHLSR